MFGNRELLWLADAFLAGLFIYRQFKWQRLAPMLVETASLSGAILLIIGAATGMAWALTQSGFSRYLATVMSNLPGGAVGFLAVSIIAFIILGSVLEGIPAIVLFGPLLFPIARQIGVHEVHYSMVVILAMGMGLFAPPFGVGYYAACAISRISPDEGMRPIIGYMVALFLAWWWWRRCPGSPSASSVEGGRGNKPAEPSLRRDEQPG